MRSRWWSPNHQQASLLPAQEIDNRVDLIAFNYMAQDLDPVAAYYRPEFISQKLIGPDVVLLKRNPH